VNGPVERRAARRTAAFARGVGRCHPSMHQTPNRCMRVPRHARSSTSLKMSSLCGQLDCLHGPQGVHQARALEVGFAVKAHGRAHQDVLDPFGLTGEFGVPREQHGSNT
jgi:hypothetical protein